MISSLPHLLKAISEVESEQALRSHLVPKIGDYFAATRRGIFFFDTLEKRLRDQFPLADQTLQNAMQVGLSVEHNPVVRYLTEHHAPVHEALVTSPKAWTVICPRPDHWHVMVGPIVNQGQLIGVIGCTRERSRPAFDAKNLADLSAVCLHLSVWISTVRAQNQSANNRLSENQPSKLKCLTPRELQIAEQVALGQTNAEIGKALWITENSVKQALKRMFRKLDVSSRTEMVAQLFATGHQVDPS